MKSILLPHIRYKAQSLLWLAVGKTHITPQPVISLTFNDEELLDREEGRVIYVYIA